MGHLHRNALLARANAVAALVDDGAAVADAKRHVAAAAAKGGELRVTAEPRPAPKRKAKRKARKARTH